LFAIANLCSGVPSRDLFNCKQETGVVPLPIRRTLASLLGAAVQRPVLAGAECIGAVKTRIEGKPDMKLVSTSFVERQRRLTQQSTHAGLTGHVCNASIGATEL
jgi:hypothetical protein